MTRRATWCAVGAALLSLATGGCTADTVAVENLENIASTSEAVIAPPAGLDTTELAYAVQLRTHLNKCLYMPVGQPAVATDCSVASQALALKRVGDEIAITRFGGTEVLAPSPSRDVRLLPPAVPPSVWTFRRLPLPSVFSETMFEISFSSTFGGRYCLDSAMLEGSASLGLRFEPCTGSASQTWRLSAHPHITYRIRSSTGQCLTESSVPVEPLQDESALVVLAACSTSPTQRWRAQTYPATINGRDVVRFIAHDGRGLAAGAWYQKPPTLMRVEELGPVSTEYWALDSRIGVPGVTFVDAVHATDGEMWCFDGVGTVAGNPVIGHVACPAPGLGLRFILEPVP